MGTTGVGGSLDVDVGLGCTPVKVPMGVGGGVFVPEPFVEAGFDADGGKLTAPVDPVGVTVTLTVDAEPVTVPET